MPSQEIGIPTELLSKLESLMPGQSLTLVTPGGRRFTIMEEEEVNLILSKAGYIKVRAKGNGDGN